MTLEARARLAQPARRAIPAFRDAAERAEVAVQERDGVLLLTLQRGAVEVSAEGAGTAIRLLADEPVSLQMLRDLVAERVAALGLALEWQSREAGTRPANLSLARIERLERISPSYVRVTVTGPDLARFADGGMHFRLLLGPEGADWPDTDEAGVTRWPGGVAAWHRPVYTTRSLEPLGMEGAARLGFDVFLHAGGRVTDWVGRAAPGAEIALTGPGGGMPVPAPWVGVIGDETAVPVAARILAAMPPETVGEAVLFVPEAADVQVLAHPPGLRLRWVLRGGAETPLDALRALTPPAADRHLFFAAERAEAVAARAHLRTLGFGRGTFVASAYWHAPGSDDDHDHD
ncbi:siderophore-interacting protein [Oceanicella sp. SM1341]|uniref:siderophore-interacting protein n=1 Tax=Oceanicella sp. SM1341 TaxID=1548889 RepID=UPI000E4C1D28|nr:siderophore-interacting protein [Oceanicella sp. SM1341]